MATRGTWLIATKQTLNSSLIRTHKNLAEMVTGCPPTKKDKLEQKTCPPGGIAGFPMY